MDPEHPLWRADIPGQSTPVIADGKLYIMGYLGEGGDLQEGVICFDAETGRELWRPAVQRFSRATLIYLRYATSESHRLMRKPGMSYIQGHAVACWRRLYRRGQSLPATLTDGGVWKIDFPQQSHGLARGGPGPRDHPRHHRQLGRTRPGCGPVLRLRQKDGRALVWSSSPGDRPKDNSFSNPWHLGWLNGKRVLYSATGDGAVVCVNARTGEPLWRVPLTKAGINSALLIHNNDKVISIFGTPYEPGQLVALKIPNASPANAASAPVMNRAARRSEPLER